MVTVYGEKCVSDKSVRKWSARFCAGHESVGDDQVRQTLSSRVISSTRWTTTEETPEREALQLGRRTQGHYEGLGLVSHRNSGNKESCGLFISGIVVLRPMVNILNKVYICTHRVVSYLFI
ncbi:hypothetical protein TNIN_321991 [Trichonephila inaurata madagascariensis]|uniref:Mos1 transposase HTH domain-containing protein n=1 Tax=Trichonephila inaurata madagascariensis TaxID=2747483 RepID=A0A8X6ME00_9ARAC|nr:hypothetical protein TNIN_321991 [Trichonephila inaurata madagascariensis]